MDSEIRIPVTAAVFAAMAVLLSGCMAYNAASAVVSVGSSVVSTTASVAGDIVTSPFDSDDSDKKIQLISMAGFNSAIQPLVQPPWMGGSSPPMVSGLKVILSFSDFAEHRNGVFLFHAQAFADFR